MDIAFRTNKIEKIFHSAAALKRACGQGKIAKYILTSTSFVI